MKFPNFGKSVTFQALVSSAAKCNLCPNMDDRRKVLSEANGSLDSKVLFIAEAPGRLGADITGIPLCGDKTGDNFERLINSIQWQRDDVFITNAVLCNPLNEGGNNRKPSNNEIRNCSGYLDAVIDIIDPDVIVTLGSTALSALLIISYHAISLKEHNRTPIQWNNRIVFPLYHPSPLAALHRSISNQTSDFYQLSKFVSPLEGLKKRQRYKNTDLASKGDMKQSVLANLILYIVSLQGSLSRFKLTKILYLIEYYGRERLDESITKAAFLRQVDGPWPPEMNKWLNAMRGIELEIRGSGARQMISASNERRFEPRLEKAYMEIADMVVSSTQNASNKEIKIKVYLTKPMKNILKAEKLGLKCLNKSLF